MRELGKRLRGVRERRALAKSAARLEAVSRFRSMPNERKLDARHKIQLGGLVILSGLRDALGLKGDLQKDVEQADGAAMLVGACAYLKEALEGAKGREYRERFKAKGRELLAKNDERPDEQPVGLPEGSRD